MQLPLILKGFNVFADGLNKYGVLMDIKRPKVAYKTEDYPPRRWLGRNDRYPRH